MLIVLGVHITYDRIQNLFQNKKKKTRERKIPNGFVRVAERKRPGLYNLSGWRVQRSAHLGINPTAGLEHPLYVIVASLNLLHW